MLVIWCVSAMTAVAWIWFSAIRKARRIYAFDRSVGFVTVYAWHVLVSLFWTLLLAVTSIGLFLAQQLDP